MPRIDFGPFRPDVQGVDRNVMVNVINVVPTVAGFRPVGNLARNSVEPLPTGDCIGSASFLDETGSGATYAGTLTRLYKLAPDKTWTDVTNVGGDYTTTTGERWRFAQFGTLGLATNFADPVQKIDLTDPAAVWEDLGGSPPRARYINVIGDFVELGNLSDASGLVLFPQRVQWSELNNAEGWVPGVNSSGLQDFPDGGPVRNIIGGDTGFIFQSEGIQRQIFTPASDLVFQFDKIVTDRGLLAPDSITHIAQEVYFLDRNGFYIFDISSNKTRAIGVDKVDAFFNSDKRVGTDSLIQSAFDPVNHFVFWSYVSNDNVTSIPDRILVYNWETKEFGKVHLRTHAFVQYITERFSLDELDVFGTMETLLFSLDSPFWSGGNTILGIYGDDDFLSGLTGNILEATFETSDGQLTPDGRSHLSGVTPIINASQIFARAGFREKISDVVTFTPEEALESTGQIPLNASGRYMRLKFRIPASIGWNLAQGFDPVIHVDGFR